MKKKWLYRYGLALTFAILEMMYFKGNIFPKTDSELFADGILLILLSLTDQD